MNVIDQSPAILVARNPIENRDVLSLGQQLESVFLAEMLKVSGVGKTPESFGGGEGEDQFSSFLREAQAKEMVLAGGLGLAKKIDSSLGISRS